MLDPYCRAHDLENLYVVDASFFPSSTAVNPALTIAAQALRVGDHLRERLGCCVGAASTRSCSGMTERAERLAGYRDRRDQFFAQHPHSPLSEGSERRSRARLLSGARGAGSQTAA